MEIIENNLINTKIEIDTVVYSYSYHNVEVFESLLHESKKKRSESPMIYLTTLT